MSDDRRTPVTRQDSTRAEVLRELRAIRAELTAIRKLFDHFAGALLNAKFQYGQPFDRWRRR